MDTILMSPATMEEMKTHLRDESKPLPPHFQWLHGFQIQALDCIPDRFIETRWKPPAGDNYCSYGPEDECWMRPLGLGTTYDVDLGPYIAMLSEKAMNSVKMEILRGPSPLYAAKEHIGLMMRFDNMIEQLLSNSSMCHINAILTGSV